MSNICNESIDSDQFAYRKGHNTTMALIKNQHYWLKWLDRDYDFVRVFSFDFTKAFDSVPHDILIPKIAMLYINPYIFNWLTSFLESRQQRVRVDGTTTGFKNINHGLLQGTVLGLVLFSIMVNDPVNNLLILLILLTIF
jgi:hypothetical protein